MVLPSNIGDVPYPARDAITSHTTGPLPANQSLPEKTARLKEVEIPDPKIVAIRERKARAAAKKRAERKELRCPLRTVAPNPSFLLKDVDEGTVESQEDEHVSVPNNDSANTNPDHTVEHDESFGESRGHGEDETRLTKSPVPARNPEKTVAQDLVPMDIVPMELRELLAHLAPPERVREEMNAYETVTSHGKGCQVQGALPVVPEKLTDWPSGRGMSLRLLKLIKFLKLRVWKAELA
ncbi:hypothetical protein Tco_0685423 [Tanacetum coccineum]